MELAVAPELPAVDVDVLLMDHVLTNLLENAALHGASERPIEIRGSSDGTTVRLAVVDHGAGVPSADREQIFGEFVRRQAPTDGNGTGLGLTIVRALVEAHDGRVWCEETPGGGATFVVELPVEQREDGNVSAVLLVEDDRTLRRALRASFRNWDFDVAEAGSGEEALSIASNAPPDLVVLDLTLPGIDGLETLRHLRTFSDVPVVVLTVRDAPARQDRRARVGRRRLRAEAVRARRAARALARAPAPCRTGSCAQRDRSVRRPGRSTWRVGGSRGRTNRCR